MSISAQTLISEFKKSGKFDDIRKRLLDDFSTSPSGQQLYTSLSRLASETEAPSKTALIGALGKSAFFNNSKRMLGAELLSNPAFKSNLRHSLEESLKDLSNEMAKEASSAAAVAISTMETEPADETAMPSTEAASVPQDDSAIQSPLPAVDHVLPHKDESRDNMDVDVVTESVHEDDAKPQPTKVPEAPLEVGSRVAVPISHSWYAGIVVSIDGETAAVRVDGSDVDIATERLINLAAQSLAALALGDTVYALFLDDPDETFENNEFYRATVQEICEV
ncbi:hypothetical protein HDU91_000795 [Kappamyces sp. JEL0680]|nr:hypothetical protein HDU91_000795 [Kappamyces sp. JEL0680]